LSVIQYQVDALGKVLGERSIQRTWFSWHAHCRVLRRYPACLIKALMSPEGYAEVGQRLTAKEGRENLWDCSTISRPGRRQGPNYRDPVALRRKRRESWKLQNTVLTICTLVITNLRGSGRRPEDPQGTCFTARPEKEMKRGSGSIVENTY
jgi:hypothetical protein